MSTFKSLCMVAALSLCAPVAATASTVIDTQTVTFSNDVDIVNRRIQAGQVVSAGQRGFDEATNREYRADIDFSIDVSTFNIDRFEVILGVRDVGLNPPTGVNADGMPTDGSDDTPGTENWFAEIVGGGSSAANQSFWKHLIPGDTTLTFDLNALNDTGETGSDRIDGVANTAFARTVDDNQISIRVKELSGGTDDQFVLTSITVKVYEAAPIPLPASGLFLLGAVGGLAAWKRRKVA